MFPPGTWASLTGRGPAPYMVRFRRGPPWASYLPDYVHMDGRLAQRESTPFTRVGSKVQSLQRPPSKSPCLLGFMMVRKSVIVRPRLPESVNIREHPCKIRALCSAHVLHLNYGLWCHERRHQDDHHDPHHRRLRLNGWGSIQGTAGRGHALN